MPIYEYKCENEHVFDVMQRMSEDSLTECIECGALVRKVLQPVGISFKGSGFYSTDYNKKGPKPESTETAKSSDASNGSSDAKDSSSEKKTSQKTETPKKGD